eukprot:6182231-Pleurochrysis_carterae.AAC.1
MKWGGCARLFDGHRRVRAHACEDEHARVCSCACACAHRRLCARLFRRERARARFLFARAAWHGARHPTAGVKA